MKERHKKIIRYLVEEYIKTGRPVSSKRLFEKSNLKVSSATLRSEMHELTEEGYFEKPYLSSGRIPAIKAYRFFLESFCHPKISSLAEKRLEELFEKEIEEERVLKNLVGKIAFFAKSLAFIFWQRTLFWEGLFYLLSAPEFQKTKETVKMVRFLEGVFKEIEKEVQDVDIKIYLGEESPFGRCNDLSFILGRLNNGLVGIFGPLRMNYSKNIALVEKVKELLDEELSYHSITLCQKKILKRKEMRK